MTPAKQALMEWVTANVEPSMRGELSRLTAAYVVAAIRTDRAKRQTSDDKTYQFLKDILGVPGK